MPDLPTGTVTFLFTDIEGSTQLARRIVTILPPLFFEEALECTKIHSISGLLPAHAALVTTRPFRAPHHSISDAGLIGGGSITRKARSASQGTPSEPPHSRQPSHRALRHGYD